LHLMNSSNDTHASSTCQAASGCNAGHERCHALGRRRSGGRKGWPKRSRALFHQKSEPRALVIQAHFPSSAGVWRTPGNCPHRLHKLSQEIFTNAAVRRCPQRFPSNSASCHALAHFGFQASDL